MRKPFQGIWNIIRFNWHFYLAAVLSVMVLVLLKNLLPYPYSVWVEILCLLIMASTIVSLAVSFYVYDLSDLYKLKWADGLSISNGDKIINLNAGFDETSVLLQAKFPKANLVVFDFYDPLTHTEVSIKRARKAYPAFPNTQRVITSEIPLENGGTNYIFIVLSVHEIRNKTDRNIFFVELNRILKDNGKIVIVEHLRDLPNFLAYNIGFFHFIAKPSLYNSFKKGNLSVVQEMKITPFITTFILEKRNGIKP